MSEQQLATAEQIRNAGRGVRRFKDGIVLPVSGLVCRIRSLTKKELSEYSLAVLDARGKPKPLRIRDAENRLFVLCLVDADGNPLLAPADADLFNDWDSADTQALYNECFAWVGLGRDDMESLVKN